MSLLSGPKFKNWWLGEPASIRQILDYRKAAGYTAREDIKRWWLRTGIWVVLRHTPAWLKYYTVVELATKGEEGNPADVTAKTMMGRAGYE